jgi:hypothetical protein
MTVKGGNHSGEIMFDLCEFSLCNFFITNAIVA